MMNAADVAQTIQLIIAPVVLITACALIQNAILMRYAAVGQYMRLLLLIVTTTLSGCNLSAMYGRLRLS